METETTADSGFDLSAAMDSVATAMTGTDEHKSEDAAPIVEEMEKAAPAAEQVEKKADPVVTETTAVQPKAPPKSWAKDMHEHWGKLDPKVQDYYELREKQMLDGIEQYKGDATYAKQLRETLVPYQAMLRSQGVDDVSAVKYLMNAHYQLTNGTEQSRRAAYERIGSELGFATAAQGEQQQTVDPEKKALQDRLDKLESGLSARQEAERREAHAKHMSAVETFSSDPKNIYFGEVANDMVGFINQGMSLGDAYDRAIYANPVTRAKELSRLQTEATEKLKEKAKPEVEAARKATAVNVRSAESRREPTEPKGSMEETMRERLEVIKRRVN